MSLDALADLFFGAVSRGGLVMWPILFVSVVVWYVAFDRLLRILWVRWARRRFLKRVERFAELGDVKERTGERAFNSFLAQLPAFKAGEKDPAYHYRELLATLVPDLERGFATITTWISVAPLLGLLGTVVGMVDTFEVINKFGIGNPHLMAQGISKALLTTQAGLTVAFPALLFRMLLVNQNRRLVHSLVTDQEVITGKLVSGPLVGEA